MRGYKLFPENPYVTNFIDVSGRPSHYSRIGQLNRERFHQCAANYYGLSKVMATKIYTEACLDVKDEVGWRGWKKLRINEYQHLLFKHGARLMIEKANARQQKRMKARKKLECYLRNGQFEKYYDCWFRARRSGVVPKDITIRIIESMKDSEVENVQVVNELFEGLNRGLAKQLTKITNDLNSLTPTNSGILN